MRVPLRSQNREFATPRGEKIIAEHSKLPRPWQFFCCHQWKCPHTAREGKRGGPKTPLPLPRPLDTPRISDCGGRVHWRPWRPARDHRRIRQFFLSSSLHDRSHPLSSWEQCAPWGKIQQSTSDGGDGRCNGNATATAMDGATAMHRRRDGNYNATATGRRRRTAVAGGSAGAKTKTTTEATVEATAIAGGVDTLAVTTATTAMIVTATTMTQLNVCDVLTEEKERPLNLSRMHATIK